MQKCKYMPKKTRWQINKQVSGVRRTTTFSVYISLCAAPGKIQIRGRLCCYVCRGTMASAIWRWFDRICICTMQRHSGTTCGYSFFVFFSGLSLSWRWDIYRLRLSKQRYIIPGTTLFPCRVSNYVRWTPETHKNKTILKSTRKKENQQDDKQMEVKLHFVHEPMRRQPPTGTLAVQLVCFFEVIKAPSTHREYMCAIKCLSVNDRERLFHPIALYLHAERIGCGPWLGHQTTPTCNIYYFTYADTNLFLYDISFFMEFR